MSSFNILSDLHLKSAPDFNSSNQADILILAGDIDVGTNGLAWARKHYPEQEIVYVAGNHEYYHHDYHQLLTDLRATALKYNIHFLENNEILLDGIRILGCTLWTNYMATVNMLQNKAMVLAENTLADHRLIKLDKKYSSTDLFTAEYAYELHCTSVKWLEIKLIQETFAGKTLVVTHHGPSIACAHQQFGHNDLGSAFYSSLDYLLEAADVWVYGHTHSNFNEMVEGTRLVSNQRGYPGENIQGFDENLIIDIN